MNYSLFKFGSNDKVDQGKEHILTLFKSKEQQRFMLHIKQFTKSNRLKKVVNQYLSVSSRVAQWKRAGPITQRSEDQNLALLVFFITQKTV